MGEGSHFDPAEAVRAALAGRVAIPAPDACWEWLGARITGGYGHLQRDGEHHYVHRLAYECVSGPIPPSFVIDHLCRNPSCVNPAHLEPVTNRENIVRGPGSKTHCKRGHPLSGDNIRVTPEGWRRCRACARLHLRRHRGRAR